MNTKTTLAGLGLLFGLASTAAFAIGAGVGMSVGADAASRTNRLLDGMQQQQQQQAQQKEQQTQQVQPQPTPITTETPQDDATAKMLKQANPTEQQLQQQQPNLDSGPVPVGNWRH